MRRIWIYKMLLGPLLLVQGKRMRRTALRLPEAAGERTGIVALEGGSCDLKLLFVGDSTMAGVGVAEQTAALACQVASQLAQRLGRSIRWQLVARSGIDTGRVLELLNEYELQPADVLITALGTNDVLSQRSSRQFVASYQVLIDELLRRVGARCAVVSGLPPLHLCPAAPQPLRWYLGRYAHSLDAHLRRWIGTQPSIAYISLQWATNPQDLAVDGFHPGERLYAGWAALVVEGIARLILNRERGSRTEEGHSSA
jgi:lysophospholipase L1-like esterase